MSTAAALDAPAALLAIDWGTSSLRGARLDVHGRLLEQRAFPRGILSVSPGGFGDVFEACFGDWARQGATHGTTQPNASGTDTGDAPAPMHCLISGMAGSKQGWIEAPYCACPAGFADVAAQLHWIDDPALPLPTAIVPGLCCSHPSAVAGLDDVPDVMRGEEVQILGAMHLGGWRDGLCILPGTHSKWAWVVDGQVRSFRSYMTGEFYALLSQQSLLARTV
ncbi:MAG: 2-dehydro-3-deoxygalactonokinase, partial [Burkholderiaceae bacterium]